MSGGAEIIYKRLLSYLPTVPSYFESGSDGLKSLVASQIHVLAVEENSIAKASYMNTYRSVTCLVDLSCA